MLKTYIIRFIILIENNILLQFIAKDSMANNIRENRGLKSYLIVS